MSAALRYELLYIAPPSAAVTAYRYRAIIGLLLLSVGLTPLLVEWVILTC